MDLVTLELVFRALGSKTRIARGKVQVTCPLARTHHAGGSDEKPSMVVFPEGRHGDPICSCQGCHWKGAVWRLLDELGGNPGVDRARELLGRKSLPGQPLKETKNEAIVREVSALSYRRTRRKVSDEPWHDKHALEVCDKVEAISEELYAPHRGSVPRYALARGLTLETCRAWDLGHDRELRRLMFPLRDHRGRLVALSGRLYACPQCGWAWPARGKQPKACGGCNVLLPPKFLHSGGFKRDLFLYGEQRQDLDQGRLVYVVEGNLDAPMTWQLGYRPVVATMGSNVSPIQVEKLVAWWDHILIIQDADKAGDRMVAAVTRMVAGRKKVSSVRGPDGMDPAEFTQEIAESLLGKPPFSVDK